MSRITYNSEEQVRDVAQKLREHRIPADVIHLDTGWFETDWQCDYKFAKSRFADPAKMISDLQSEGFRISMWQLPYFTQQERAVPGGRREGLLRQERGRSTAGRGRHPRLEQPEAQAWYEGLLSGLLQLEVGAIKVDFGEDAPLDGVYASGRTGWYEHNLYPLRYNKIVADMTREDDRREHHLGPQRLGRQPALSAALGRRRGEHRFRDGRDAARRPVVRPVGLHLLEPRRGRLRRQGAARPLPPLVAVLGPARRTPAATAPRRASRGSTTKSSRTTSAARWSCATS